MNNTKIAIRDAYILYQDEFHPSDVFFDLDDIVFLSKTKIAGRIPNAAKDLYVVVLRHGAEFFVTQDVVIEIGKRLSEFHENDIKIFKK